MAAKEMYDYLAGTTTADYDYTLDMVSHNVEVEDGQKNIVIKEYDDASESRVVRSNVSVFYVTVSWEYLSEANAGTLFDLFHNTSKANGMARTFKWINHGEPTSNQHTYVVRFASPLPRTIRPAALYDYASVQFKVIDRVNDS